MTDNEIIFSLLISFFLGIVISLLIYEFLT
jgi:hypothetical protein